MQRHTLLAENKDNFFSVNREIFAHPFCFKDNLDNLNNFF